MRKVTRLRARTDGRAGISALELVILTAIGLGTSVFLLDKFHQACRNVFFVVVNAIGWPYL